MLSSSTQQTDYLNVHSKRKKENILTTLNGQMEVGLHKKSKMSSNELNNSKNNPNDSDDPINLNESTSSSGSSRKAQPHNLEEWLRMFHNWNHHERIAALDLLVYNEICDIQQMRHLLSIIEPQLQRDFISLLPKELSLYVLSFLDPPDLLRAAQTCHYWRTLCEDNLLWREKCREENLLDDNECLSDLFARRIQLKNARSYARHLIMSAKNGAQNSSSTNSDLTDDTPTLSPKKKHFDYKLAYLHHKNIEYNWRYGILNYNPNGDSIQSSSSPSSLTFGQNSPLIENNVQMNIDPVHPQHSCAAAASSINIDRLDNSMRKPRILKEILHLKGHEDHVITCLQFNPISNIIVSGSDDNTLKVWSSANGRCHLTLNGHTGGVWSSQLSNDNIIISGSTDRTLRVWNAITGHCLHTLYGHTSTVRCMALHGKHVVSGSRDNTLRVWNIDSGECVHVLVGHVAAVRCVQFNGRLCVSGAYDYLVKVWDVASETCLHTLEGHNNRVYSLQFDGKHIVSGSLDTSIRVWCAETGRLKHTLIGHQSLTSGMQLRNNILVSGNADSTVRVWDISTGQCLQTLSGTNKHQSAVTCLQFNSKFVITSSDDGTVKLWDLKTGEFIRNLLTLPSGGSGGVVWRIRASSTKLVCAVGSRNGTEETKLLVLDFETPNPSNELSNLSMSTNACDAFCPNTRINSENQFLSNWTLSDNINRLESSYCINCNQAASSLSDRLNRSVTVDRQRQYSTSNTLSSSQSLASTSTSGISSLTSTPSSSNLILSSISISSLQSMIPSTTASSSATLISGIKKSSSQGIKLTTNDCPTDSRVSVSNMELDLDSASSNYANFDNNFDDKLANNEEINDDIDNADANNIDDDDDDDEDTAMEFSLNNQENGLIRNGDNHGNDRNSQPIVINDNDDNEIES
ncbi:F-box/WD repeat-containing protein 7 [Sarcoptes scabiei]|uniref:F-box/WD repeat-containing protein 7 n=1 Tax=Sarcoptes scabiei TaxID=52283 RepID=A0A834R4E7_SARSC|nr:F-box/WD repeat-containing protein 7 [Sarcoptes scabiei]